MAINRSLCKSLRAGQGTVAKWCPGLIAIYFTLLQPIAANAQTATARVLDLAAQSRSGQLAEISEKTVRLADEAATTWKRSEVLRIDWRPAPESLLEEGAQLLLANGDRLGVRPKAIDEEALRGSWERFPAWPEVTVPLESIRGALLSPHNNPLDLARDIARLRDQRETQDCFYLSNGDRLLGQLEGFQDGLFQITTATGKVTLTFPAVLEFGMNPELTSFPTAKGSHALVSLTDGSQLTVTDVRYDGKGTLHCRAAFGPELAFPVEHLVSLQFFGDRIVYLSELEPDPYVSTPYLARQWPWRRNQNVLGGPLRLGQREFARGLGMHSQALATYRLDGQFLSFQTLIGIDAAAEERGSVIFRVLADGKPIFTSDVVRGKTPPMNVGPLAIKGVQKLTLCVDFADRGDLLDHADWCDPVLIKAP